MEKEAKEFSESEKSKKLEMSEIIQYIFNAIFIKSIIKNSTGNISIISFDSNEGLAEKTSPFDTFVPLVEGKTEIVINNISYLLVSGQGIIVPAIFPII